MSIWETCTVSREVATIAEYFIKVLNTIENRKIFFYYMFDLLEISGESGNKSNGAIYFYCVRNYFYCRLSCFCPYLWQWQWLCLCATLDSLGFLSVKKC